MPGSETTSGSNVITTSGSDTISGLAAWIPPAATCDDSCSICWPVRTAVTAVNPARGTITLASGAALRELQDRNAYRWEGSLPEFVGPASDEFEYRFINYAPSTLAPVYNGVFTIPPEPDRYWSTNKKIKTARKLNQLAFWVPFIQMWENIALAHKAAMFSIEVIYSNGRVENAKQIKEYLDPEIQPGNTDAILAKIREQSRAS